MPATGDDSVTASLVAATAAAVAADAALFTTSAKVIGSDRERRVASGASPAALPAASGMAN